MKMIKRNDGRCKVTYIWYTKPTDNVSYHYIVYLSRVIYIFFSDINDMENIQKLQNVYLYLVFSDKNH